MSEHETPNETAPELSLPLVESELVAEPAKPAHTSEEARRARSSPERRISLCVAQDSLSGASGQSIHVGTLGELGRYVDELEQSLVFANAPTAELAAEIADEAEHADEIDGDYLDRGPDLAGMVVVGLEALAPHVEKLRRLTGALGFRDQAAMLICAHASAGSIPLARLLESPHETRAFLKNVWHLAELLEQTRPVIGGAA